MAQEHGKEVMARPDALAMPGPSLVPQDSDSRVQSESFQTFTLHGDRGQIQPLDGGATGVPLLGQPAQHSNGVMDPSSDVGTFYWLLYGALCSLLCAF